MADEVKTVTANDNAENKDTTNVESKDTPMIPKYRFDEVNSLLKDTTKQLEEIKKFKEDIEKNKLIEQGKQEEVYKMELSKKDEELNKYKTEVLNVKRSKIISDFGIPESFAKFITGNDESEITTSAEAIAKDLESTGLIKKKEEISKALDKSEKNEKNTPNSTAKIASADEIRKMTTDEYKKYRSEVLGIK